MVFGASPLIIAFTRLSSCFHTVRLCGVCLVADKERSTCSQGSTSFKLRATCCDDRIKCSFCYSCMLAALKQFSGCDYTLMNTGCQLSFWWRANHMTGHVLHSPQNWAELSVDKKAPYALYPSHSSLWAMKGQTLGGRSGEQWLRHLS